MNTIIYLLRSSPHNEDFILTGYATSEEEIKTLAIRYAADLFSLDPVCLWARIAGDTCIVTEGDNEYLRIFHITTIPPLTFAAREV
jgi:hypothetical protein